MLWAFAALFTSGPVFRLAFRLHGKTVATVLRYFQLLPLVGYVILIILNQQWRRRASS
jgi:hypothetical protein